MRASAPAASRRRRLRAPGNLTIWHQLRGFDPDLSMPYSARIHPAGQVTVFAQVDDLRKGNDHRARGRNAWLDVQSGYRGVRIASAAQQRGQDTVGGPVDLATLDAMRQVLHISSPAPPNPAVFGQGVM